MFSSLKQQAVSFIEPYKQKEPAVYAAAEQAVGTILMVDGFFGTINPLGGRKRPGIFGTLGGMIFGIVFMLIPTFFGSISGINKMTAITSATVVSVNTTTSINTNTTNSTTSNSCSLIASYSVNGNEYTKQSAGASSNDCALSQGQTININYDPANPGSWMYGAKTVSEVLQIFFWAGLLFLVYSVITFFIRLFSIIFGWKLLRDGRKNAANLPTDTNFQTLVSEIKQNFTSSLFGFGGSPNPPVPPVPPTPNVPSN